MEIENTTNSEVYGNTAINNTAGLLVFDLPDLPAGQGGFCKVYNNTFTGNNYENFATPGTTVSDVPPGTGLLLLSCNNTEVFGNTFTNNNVMGLGIISYEVFSVFNNEEITDESYNPVPHSIHIYDNSYSRTNDCPDMPNALGEVVMNMFTDCEIPHILYDGLATSVNGTADENCIAIDDLSSFVNLQIADWPFNTLTYEYDEFECSRNPLPSFELLAPTL